MSLRILIVVHTILVTITILGCPSFVGAAENNTKVVVRCNEVLERETVRKFIDLHNKLLRLGRDKALVYHLKEYERLTQLLAGELRRHPSISTESGRRKILKPFIEKLRTPKLSVELGDDTEALAEFLKSCISENLEETLLNALKKKTLTYPTFVTSSLKWTILMTAAEAAEGKKNFSLNRREMILLDAHLKDGLAAHLNLFPVTMFRFHLKPLSVETLVGLSARPTFPVQLTPTMKYHPAENETMSPLETLLHDIFHAEERMDRSLLWTKPKDAKNTFYFFPGRKGPRTPPPPEFIERAKEKLASQEGFHKFVFTQYLRYSEAVQAGIEILWFHIYFVDDFSKDFEWPVTMDKQGLQRAIVHQRERVPLNFKTLAQKAQKGVFGRRYFNLTEQDFNGALRALGDLAEEANP